MWALCVIVVAWLFINGLFCRSLYEPWRSYKVTLPGGGELTYAWRPTGRIHDAVPTTRIKWRTVAGKGASPQLVPPQGISDIVEFRLRDDSRVVWVVRNLKIRPDDPQEPSRVVPWVEFAVNLTTGGAVGMYETRLLLSEQESEVIPRGEAQNFLPWRWNNYGSSDGPPFSDLLPDDDFDFPWAHLGEGSRIIARLDTGRLWEYQR